MRRREWGLGLLVLLIGLLPTLHGRQEAAGKSESLVADSVAAVASDPVATKSEPPSEATALPSVQTTDPPANRAADPPAAQPAVAAPNPNDDRLKKSIQQAINYLSQTQKIDGSWSGSEPPSERFAIGITGLGALALLRSGVDPKDLRIRSAADFLRSSETTMTYTLSLQTLALCAIDPQRDAALIARNVEVLEKSQFTDGPNRGGWTYHSDHRDGIGDPSNSEFALWALDAAARTGAKVRIETWRAASAHWLRGQNPDGGWSYSSAGNIPSTGSMTAAGISSLSICAARLTFPGRPVKEEPAAIERGVQWMTKNFSARRNPNHGTFFLHYALNLRRAADETGTNRAGDHDWRQEISEYFVVMQNKLTGSWRGSGALEDDPVIATSLVLLALTGTDPPRELPKK